MDMNPPRKGIRSLREAYAGCVRLLREILYPEGALCQGCGKISDGRCLCPACRRELVYADLLGSWDRRELRGATAWSARSHQGLPRQLVLRLKHHAVAQVAEELAAGVLPPPAECSLPPDTVVCWVPMPAHRRRERCVDHGRLLAEAVARHLALPCRPLLTRTDPRAHTQEGLNQAQRRKNLRKAFRAAEEIHFPVLLVDDVLTTGTTAERCAAVLRGAGAPEVTVMTMTHARR